MKKIYLILIPLLIFTAPVVSQNCNFICDSDFESPVVVSLSYISNAQMPCWKTTASDSLIELWHSGFNGVPSYSGNQFVEMNAYMVSTIYQNITANPGTNLSISFAHRGRAGVDTMSVSAGPVGGPYTILGFFADSNSAWGLYTINYLVPNLGTNYSIRFNSIYATLNLPTVGNFLDAVSVCSTSSTPIVALASSDTNFCEKQCIDFFDLSTNNPTSWQWNFTGANPSTSTLQNPTNVCYNGYGSFPVTLVACNQFGCDSITVFNFINEFQNPIDSIYQSNDTLYSLSAVYYQWYEATLGLISGAVNQYYVPSQPGSYYCVVNDSIGCESTSNIIVITAIETFIGNELFAISPNPNNGVFEFSFDLITTKRQLFLYVTNVFGKIIFEKTFENISGKIVQQMNLSNQPKGVYFVKVNDENSMEVRKFIIE